MQHKYKLVVFDVDGTLLDTTEGVISAVKYTIKKHGLEELEENDLRKFIGPPIQDSFARQYGLEGEILQDLATTFRNQYKDVDLLKAKPYDAIYNIMDSLVKNDVKIAVATYKRQDYATEILTHFGFDKYTKILYGADHYNKLKKKDIIKMCIDDSGIVNYKDVVMVGDSDNDAIGAENIGVSFIGVTYGFGFKNEEDVKKFHNVGVANTTEQILEFV